MRTIKELERAIGRINETLNNKQDKTEFPIILERKADIDLKNTTNSIDFVVKSYFNDETGLWYKIYRNGIVEQGGMKDIESSFTYGSILVKLPVSLKNKKYSISVTTISPNANNAVSAYVENNEFFKVYISKNFNLLGFYWNVIGVINENYIISNT